MKFDSRIYFDNLLVDPLVCGGKGYTHKMHEKSLIWNMQIETLINN